VFAVAEITAEGAATFPPVDDFTGSPNSRNSRGALAGAARIPLACFARLATRQSCSSRHQMFRSPAFHGGQRYAKGAEPLEAYFLLL
jgi:hypothetical protein